MDTLLGNQSRLRQPWCEVRGSDAVVSATWTHRDLDIVESLALRTRLLTLKQIARLWWPASARGDFLARRRLRRIAGAGLVDKVRINIHPILELEGPVFSWQPGDPSPACEKIAYQVQKRWTQPAKPTSVYLASRLTRSLFASFGGKSVEPVQATHDIHVGQMYVWYRENQPQNAKHWVGEDALPKAGYEVKDPDAFLIDESGVTDCLLEFAGKYSAKRIEAFHAHSTERQVRYELW